MSEFLAARIHPWQAFRIRKFAEYKGLPLGLVLTEAIQLLLSTENLPPELLETWLEEYHREKENVEAPQ